MRNLLELKYSETSALLMGVLLLQMWSYVAWSLFNMSHPVFSQFVNVPVLQATCWFYAGGTLVTAGWLWLCLHYRDHPKWQIPLSIGAVAIFLGIMMVSGFLSGLLAMSLGVVLAAAPMVGIIMLPARIVLTAVSVGAVILGFITYATVSGDLPYAPLFKEQLISQSPEYGKFYFWSEVYFVMPFLVIVMAVAHQFLNQWREREAKIRYMSQTDTLTELFNRRTAHDKLVELMSRPNKVPVSVLLLDLDFFKKINDTYGHLVGDRALKQAAASLRRSLRTDDVVARFGGEEFLVLLDGVTCHTARSVAERCRRLLSEVQVLDDKGNRIPITGSFGVSCMLSGSSADVDEILRQADEALYQAKSAGRNCVAIHHCPREDQSLTHPAARRAHRITRAGDMPAIKAS